MGRGRAALHPTPSHGHFARASSASKLSLKEESRDLGHLRPARRSCTCPGWLAWCWPPMGNCSDEQPSPEVHCHASPVHQPVGMEGRCAALGQRRSSSSCG
eukprot:2140217-Prymnesium_polylepis.1